MALQSRPAPKGVPVGPSHEICFLGQTLPDRQDGPNFACDETDAGFVEPTLRENDIGIPHRGLHKLQMHRTNGTEILLYNGIGASPAFAKIAFQSADEADIGIAVHENFYVHEA